MDRNPYEILQIARHAEQEVIEAAYRRLARKYHPDINRSADAKRRMQEINWAYEILKNPQSKARYDRHSGQRETTSKSSWGTTHPKYSTYSSTRSQSTRNTSTSSSYTKSTGEPSSKDSFKRRTYTPQKKDNNTIWKVLGIIGVVLIVKWLGSENDIGNSAPSSTSAPVFTTASRELDVSISDEEAILGLLSIMVEDTRYDPATSVIHKYLAYVDIQLNAGRLTYTVWKDIIDVEEFVSLGADLITFSAVVINQSELLDYSLTFIEVVNPGPQSSSASLYVSGRSDINSIASGQESVYDVMETTIDWGGADRPSNGNIGSDGCPYGCAEYIIGCDIKGNISIETGEKIYHVPGQEYYLDTVIRPEYGERWFCTEQEAIANGWRKAFK